MENPGPCDRDALALVLAFLKRRSISVDDFKDFATHRDIYATRGGERVKVQVHSKGGIVLLPQKETPLYNLVKLFVDAIGTKPDQPVPKSEATKTATLATLAERVSALESEVAALRTASP